jgi:hypothetical protein
MSPGQPVEEAMLGDHDSIATLAVTDLGRARAFYEGVLYAAGSGAFLVHPSSFAGTN